MKRKLIQLSLIVDMDDEAEHHYNNNPNSLWEHVLLDENLVLSITDLTTPVSNYSFNSQPDLPIPSEDIPF